MTAPGRAAQGKAAGKASGKATGKASGKASGKATGKATGALVAWNDARGFGFIRPDAAMGEVAGEVAGETAGKTVEVTARAGPVGAARDRDVFVHIAAFGRGAERPTLNARVSYRIGAGRGGRSMATGVRLLAPARPLRARIAALLAALVPRRREARIAMAAALSALALIAATFGQMPAEVLGPYLGMGAMSLLLYRSDKINSRKNAWRVPETTLHATDLAFGIIGGLLGQAIFGHKTAKRSFTAATAVIAAGHAALLISAGLGEPSEAEIVFAIGWLMGAQGPRF